MTKTKHVVVVLGMHRSGTSAMTKGMETLGVSLSERLLPHGNGNEKGFWEDLDVLTINEKLLSYVGLTWRSTKPFPLEVLNDRYVKTLLNEAVEHIERNVAKFTSWGFKDPRTARLLPFWLAAFEQAGVTPKFLVAIRNPLDVANSLATRDAILREHSNALWLMHVLPNLPLIKSFNHVVVDFSLYLQNPADGLKLIAEKLDLEMDVESAKAFCDKYLDNSLCHSETSVSDLLVDPASFSLLTDTYDRLREISKSDGTVGEWLATREYTEFESQYDAYVIENAGVILEAAEQNFYRNAELDKLSIKTLQEEKAEIFAQLQRSETEKHEVIQDFHRQHAQLLEQQAHLHQQQTHLHQQQTLLETLYGSTSWKISKPIRAIKPLVAKPVNLAKLVTHIVHLQGGYRQFSSKLMSVIKQEGVIGLTKRYQMLRKAGLQSTLCPDLADIHAVDYAIWLDLYGAVTPEREAKYRKLMMSFKQQPMISIVMPVYNAPEQYLREALDSIIDQIYPHWELCLGDDCSTEPHIREVLEEYKQKDCRIKVVYREENGHISAATNSALEIVTGDFIALMDNDDLLPKDALYWIANEINEHPDATLIFSDEDKITEDGSQRFDPYFKSSWNPQLFLAQNCLSHIGVYKTSVARDIGGFAIGMEGSQDWDFALRFIDQIDETQIRHIPRILYHWRAIPGSTAVSGDEKPYALMAGQRAVQAHLDRCGIDAQADLHPQLPFVQVKYNLPEVVPKVSLIIPTRNGYDILKVCLDSIYEKTTYQNFEVILVDNGSDDPTTLNYLEEMANRHDNFVVLRDDSPFNYSALNNKAAAIASGEYIALVNNDIEVITPTWLDEMVSYAIQPSAGAVGARLWYPDMTLQHGGVVLVRGVASHAHKYFAQHTPGYFGRAMLSQNFVAVTAACLVVKKSIFEEVNGLNEQDLTIAFNDIDFCLKVHSAGYKNVWVADAELIHYESKTRGFEDTPEKQARFKREIAYMQNTWQHLIDDDPYYNPNLNGFNEDFTIAAVPRVEY